MTATQKVNKFEDITIEMRNLYERKNADYGDSFSKSFEDWGMPMACIRLQDKMNRITHLVKAGGQQVNEESLQDTLIDLANYAVMTLMELQKEDKDDE